MWVLDHLDDLESDFSVFHRVEDIYSMDGPRFFSRAIRISAYDGVMTARLTAEQEKQQKGSKPHTGRVGSTSTGWQKTSLESASPLLGGERREVTRG